MKPKREIHTGILIAGGGPAGMATALSAAESGHSRVTVVDDNPSVGGQIWRKEVGTARAPEAGRVVDLIGRGKISVINNTAIVARLGSKSVFAAGPEGALEIAYERLVIATGAREMFLPFPNWTLPNICGAGGLQALVKGGLSVKGKRVVVAGTGPLLPEAAAYLRSKGAKIPLIAEQASKAKLFRLAARTLAVPGKLGQALKLRSRLRGVPILTGAFVEAAHGEGKLEAVDVRHKGGTRTVKCDYLACGFHLLPNTELAALFDCKIENGCVATDEYQRTTTANVLCAGEPGGVGGLELSITEGTIAGLSAAGEFAGATRLFGRRRRWRRFASALDRAFSLSKELRALPDDDTVLCRCEDVVFGDAKGFGSFREAKLQTRCGMGACQGRICEPAAGFLFGWERGSVRPPIFPVKLRLFGE